MLPVDDSGQLPSLRFRLRPEPLDLLVLTSTVLDMLEFFRSHFFQENWASVVVNILLQGITPFAGGGNKCREEAIGLLFLGSPGSGAHRS
jgi:hypothetical protein